MNRRRTAAVIATAGALALSVLNAPAAQAKDTGIVVSDLVINNDKPIVVGTSRVVEPSVSLRLDPACRVQHGQPAPLGRVPFLYRGSSGRPGKLHGAEHQHLLRAQLSEGPLRGQTSVSIPIRRRMRSTPTATPPSGRSAGTSCCSRPTAKLRPRSSRQGPEHVSLRRAAKLSVADATPEPVTQGKKITVAGKLTRANWTTKKNDAYAGSSVSLQFRAKNATTFKTLKKVTTNSAGALRTTVTASTDGFFRWVYYGNTTTGTATSGQDYVDVR